MAEANKQKNKSRQFKFFRVLAFPGNTTPGGGILESLQLERRRGRMDLLFDFQALEHTAPPELVERDGRPWEHIRGEYVPRRWRFIRGKLLQGENIGVSLEGLPWQHPDRLIYAGLAWRTLEGQCTYMVDLLKKKDDTLLLAAEGCVENYRVGPVSPIEFERNWSPPPLSPARRMPMPRRLWQRFGGDPITIHLKGRERHFRLFIGGLDTQPKERPRVEAVLNLGDMPSRWCTDGATAHPADRWAQKGEGSHGMDAGSLAREAGWVIERLQREERVYVHCSAGMNRSASVCCAVLILLEGLSAEAALTRVREQHPWARPDPRHWLALRWLAFERGVAG